jgi:alanine racemase
MGRVGRPWRQAAELAPRLAENDALDFVGVWTHLAVADEAQQDDFTHRQLNAFDSLLAELERQGCRPPIAHAANSAGLVRFPESHYDMVRAGIALYGYMASVEGRQQAAIEAKVKLEPALQLAAPVTFVKRVAAGTPISYGATWRAPQPTWIATVRAGYADGYPRALSGRAAATVGDRPARIAGRVCMDQMMLAVDTPEDEPPAVGEEAVLIGPGGEGQAPAADVLAEACDTIAYELLVRVSARVTRQYVNATPGDALAT